MLSEENNKKVYNLYQKTTIGISVKIFNQFSEQKSESPMLMSELEDFVSDAINEFSSLFVKLVREEGMTTEDGNFSNNFVEYTRNIFRDRLLTLGAKTDFIPNEDLVSYCCKETVSLIYYTERLLED